MVRLIEVLGNPDIDGCIYHFQSRTSAYQSTACHACFTRGYQEEYPVHEVNPGPKPYLSKCEEGDLSNRLVHTYMYLRLDMGRVGSTYKLAANAICDKGLLNYQIGGVIVLWIDINT